MDIKDPTLQTWLLDFTDGLESSARRKPLLLPWDPAYALGVPQLDEDHAKLFDMLGEFHELRVGHAAPSKVKLAIDELQDLVRCHFAVEERIMTELGYPALAAHRDEHSALLAELAAVSASFYERLSQPGDVVWPHMNLLLRITVGHILGADMQLQRWGIRDRI